MDLGITLTHSQQIFTENLLYARLYAFTEGLPDPGNLNESYVDPVLKEPTVL